ncbi:hypothetical protein L3X38_024928 [Prunus dulcis]|uniref:Aromatic amino acid beta-eliminating lyase/threonine aldolase domain-containing protein n=1 Tax=Prunus dulcis TaxID=3755 RepID=A0AAD4Z6L6_PRUDU|nr:hypothetical protein L3X38_024928 [Prunus dulcis]
MSLVSGIIAKCSCGGRCLTAEYTDRVEEIAKEHGLKLHINGARIFNSSVVSQLCVPVDRLVQVADLVLVWFYNWHS